MSHGMAVTPALLATSRRASLHQSLLLSVAIPQHPLLPCCRRTPNLPPPLLLVLRLLPFLVRPGSIAGELQDRADRRL